MDKKKAIGAKLCGESINTANLHTTFTGVDDELMNTHTHTRTMPLLINVSVRHQSDVICFH